MGMSVYLHKTDVEKILEFLEAINPDHGRVELIVENCGIGSTVTAKIHGVTVNDITVSVEQTIIDHSDW